VSGVRRKLRRQVLRKLGPAYKHATMIVTDRKDGRYGWAVWCDKTDKILLGPRGHFNDEDAAWEAGWQEVLRRERCA
jgi:hypothetical protein